MMHTFGKRYDKLFERIYPHFLLMCGNVYAAEKLTEGYIENLLMKGTRI